MAFRFSDPRQRLLKANGSLLANGSIKFLESGSSSVLKATYSDPGLTTQNPNPINLGSGGIPSNPVWMDGVYRVIQYSGPNGSGAVVSDDDPVTQENISGVLSKWSAAIASNGGYATGALLQKADGTGYWQNTVSGNTTNPDLGGTGWLEISAIYDDPSLDAMNTINQQVFG